MEGYSDISVRKIAQSLPEGAIIRSLWRDGFNSNAGMLKPEIARRLKYPRKEEQSKEQRDKVDRIFKLFQDMFGDNRWMSSWVRYFVDEKKTYPDSSNPAIAEDVEEFKSSAYQDPETALNALQGKIDALPSDLKAGMSTSAEALQV